MNSFLSVAALSVGAALSLSACQTSRPAHSRDDFRAKTHRTYNPETGSFEQEPPYGKQSNKSDTIPGS